MSWLFVLSGQRGVCPGDPLHPLGPEEYLQNRVGNQPQMLDRLVTGLTAVLSSPRLFFSSLHVHCLFHQLLDYYYHIHVTLPPSPSSSHPTPPPLPPHPTHVLLSLSSPPPPPFRVLLSLDLAADRGAFIDQSQSLNAFLSDPNYDKLTAMHFYGWKKGLKTGRGYYLYLPFTLSQHWSQHITTDTSKLLTLINTWYNKHAFY